MSLQHITTKLLQHRLITCRALAPRTWIFWRSRQPQGSQAVHVLNRGCVSFCCLLHCECNLGFSPAAVVSFGLLSIGSGCSHRGIDEPALCPAIVYQTALRNTGLWMPIFFRFIVVFLQATVEDLVRIQLTNNKKFSFQSGAEIDKALKHAGFDSSSLKIAIIIGVARFNQSTARSPEWTS
jgi:hypothetical protein